MNLHLEEESKSWENAETKVWNQWCSKKKHQSIAGVFYCTRRHQRPEIKSNRHWQSFATSSLEAKDQGNRITIDAHGYQAIHTTTALNHMPPFPL